MEAIENSIFNTHDVLVCRTSNVSDLQLCFTDNSKRQLLDTFQEFLEEHFEPEERENANNSVIFKQFMEETFYPDEISSEYEMEVYYDVSDLQLGTEHQVIWSIDVREK